MADHKTNPHRRVISEEKSTPLGSVFVVNHTIFWWLFVALLFVVGVVIALLTHNVIVGLGTFIVLPGVVVVMVVIPIFDGFKTTTIAMLFRKSEHKLLGWRGFLVQATGKAEAGETHALPKPGQKPPKNMLGIMGNVRFTAWGPPNSSLDKRLGIVIDDVNHTLASIVEVRATPLTSLPSEEITSCLGAYAYLLDSLVTAGAVADRFVWRDQTFCGETIDPWQLTRDIRAMANLNRSDPPNQEVFLARSRAMGSSSTIHRTTLTLSVLRSAVKRQARLLGSDEAVLVEQLKLLNANLRPGADSPLGVRYASNLSWGQLILENRLALDPVFAQPYWEYLSMGMGDEYADIRQSLAWPETVDFSMSPDICRLGDTYHCGLYISNFARSGMTPQQFEAVVNLRIPKTITTVVQMIPLHKAQKRAERLVTGTSLRNNDKLVSQRRVTAVEQIALQQVTEHELEAAAAKNLEARTRCYIDVTGISPQAVKDNVRSLVEAAGTGRFTVETLTGRQQLGIWAAMPIGRGLASIEISNWL